MIDKLIILFLVILTSCALSSNYQYDYKVEPEEKIILQSQDQLIRSERWYKYGTGISARATIKIVKRTKFLDCLPSELEYYQFQIGEWEILHVKDSRREVYNFDSSGWLLSYQDFTNNQLNYEAIYSYTIDSTTRLRREIITEYYPDLESIKMKGIRENTSCCVDIPYFCSENKNVGNWTYYDKKGNIIKTKNFETQ